MPSTQTCNTNALLTRAMLTVTSDDP